MTNQSTHKHTLLSVHEKGQQLPLFTQLSICLDQPPSVLAQQQQFDFTLIRNLSTKASSYILFLKGAAVELILQPELLLQLCQAFFVGPVSIFFCSSACETLEASSKSPLEIQKVFDSLENENHIKSCQIAGLGTWVECTQLGPTLDFSTLSNIPFFVAVTAHPDTSRFMEQLDLALAAAAFDLEPVLLLVGEAEACLHKEYSNSVQMKKLSSAKVYGVKECHSGEAAYTFLKTHFDQSSLIVIEKFKSSSEKLNNFLGSISELNSLERLNAGTELNSASQFLVM